jgi:hypothetical protein
MYKASLPTGITNKQGDALYSAKKAAENQKYVTDTLEKMQEQVDAVGKSETELARTMMEAANATDAEMAKFDEYASALKAAEDAGRSWQEVMSESVENVLEKFTELDLGTRTVLADLTANLANVSFDAALTGFQEFGKALGSGDDAAESFGAAMAAMGQQILDQLPMLFLQAGLQLIAQGQWLLGLGLVTAAGSSALINGYVQGKTSENALGGVYGQYGAEAFKMGSVFSNRIVDSPTYFQFAKGGGFAPGVMGEAGPEAIVPLKRGADGSLGIGAFGRDSDAAPSVYVIIQNNTGAEVQEQQSTDSGGNQIRTIIIGTVKSAVADGSMDGAFSSRYGMKARGV